MKDYYYILGLGKEASLPEIQQAYKKLSLKFHPKDNGNDPFFVMHFEKIKEAYLVLIDDHKRYRYDKALNAEISAEVDQILEGPKPVIASFFASKKESKKGELLTISWEVLNTENVHINLIGDVASNGTQTIRLNDEAEDEAYLILELTANNSTSKQTSTKEIRIKNLAYSPKATAQQQTEALPSNQHKSTVSKKTSKPKKKKPSKSNKNKSQHVEEERNRINRADRRRGEITAYILVAVMFFIILLMLYILHSINPMF